MSLIQINDKSCIGLAQRISCMKNGSSGTRDGESVIWSMETEWAWGGRRVEGLVLSSNIIGREISARSPELVCCAKVRLSIRCGSLGQCGIHV